MDVSLIIQILIVFYMVVIGLILFLIALLKDAIETRKTFRNFISGLFGGLAVLFGDYSLQTQAPDISFNWFRMGIFAGMLFICFGISCLLCIRKNKEKVKDNLA